MTALGAKSHSREDIVGQRFGLLVVLSYTETRSGHAHWRCRCDCGNESTVSTGRLKSGMTTSCGHLRGLSLESHRGTHGAFRTPTWRSWAAIKARCFTPSNKNYPKYGGAGITMCDRWRNSFDAFREDMGERPEGTSIDRYPDQRGNYEPGNCRWATPKQQAENRTYTPDGEAVRKATLAKGREARWSSNRDEIDRSNAS